VEYLFYQPDVAKGVNTLLPEEALHCIRVLRKKVGEIIHITDGAGNLYAAQLTQAQDKACTFQVISHTTSSPPRPRLTVAVSPIKHPDRFEWLIEKCTEAGVHQFVPVICRHTQKLHVRTDRLRKVAISAMKQSLRMWLPEIQEPVLLADWLLQVSAGLRFICTACGKAPSDWVPLIGATESLAVLIGPEGDFSADELKAAAAHQFLSVSLGPNRLRTETAAVAAALLVQAFGRSKL
jgi:16S rRNA (uracil1498-N3)-methyltransferase